MIYWLLKLNWNWDFWNYSWELSFFLRGNNKISYKKISLVSYWEKFLWYDSFLNRKVVLHSSMNNFFHFLWRVSGHLGKKLPDCRPLPWISNFILRFGRRNNSDWSIHTINFQIILFRKNELRLLKFMIEGFSNQLISLSWKDFFLIEDKSILWKNDWEINHSDIFRFFSGWNQICHWIWN